MTTEHQHTPNTSHLSIGARMHTTGQYLTREEQHQDRTVLFGFWIYLMTDFVLFAALFATYAVLRTGGASIHVDAPFVLVETLILLASSFLCGMALLAARSRSVLRTLVLLGGTALLGASFLAFELSEFASLIANGSGPQASGILSAYFTLVGTHGFHIFIGLVWVAALMIAIWRRGLSRANKRKLVLWSLFWHFLDLVWIFIFTIVYLFAV